MHRSSPDRTSWSRGSRRVARLRAILWSTAVVLVPCGSCADPIGAPQVAVVGTFDPHRDLIAQLEQVAAIDDAERRDAALETLWAEARAQGRIPWCSGERAVFLYRGPATSVAVAGDHNGWSPDAAPLRRLEPLDLWLRQERFASDARLDYKFVVDGTDWILDPANPSVQWSGFGPNSQLAMPDYEPSQWIAPRTTTPPGTTSGELFFDSAHLGRRVVYRVHTPAPKLRGDGPLAVLFVTDGHEYLDPRLGALASVHDNLLAAGLIRPVLLVFIDPRSEGVNLRGQELADDPRLGRALTQELLPILERTFELAERAEERGILGTSLGGLAALMIGARERETIGLTAIQSPALWFAPDAVSEAFADGVRPPARVFLSFGRIRDGADDVGELMRRFGDGVPVTVRIENEGHSWGQWRALVDDVLITLFPAG
ncbi:alpha/beta hydrolase-fold protein [Engelhardtia mirabilis]|uniref:Enterobactin/ferric enterobactin esterase n=1 Tax=Engelhardtia mirabilis TaxID=2528011 RepID=A0A518BQ82_9BACT|nr:enterobactin/ferric enterobactin esterase [Planctomycetes bacterium Pla133]QDV03448.1 enterobactin/ferric enterobactin esterase [Planctomycetes bacterium Pla86]